MEAIRPFELLENLPAGGSAEAVLLKWNGVRYVPSEKKIIIHDFVQTHGDCGDRGYAFMSDESGLWQVLSGLFQQESGL